MRIADNSMGTGVAIEAEENDSHELVNIATRLMPGWLTLFAQKNADYGSGFSNELGIQGQYSDIHRKVGKLRRAMWDGESLEFEGVDEIIRDLIGNLFLTLHMLQLKEEADRVYVYTEDDAAVDHFFRMVGGEPENALKMSGLLQPPFKDLVRERAHRILEQLRSEEEARFPVHQVEVPFKAEDEDFDSAYADEPKPTTSVKLEGVTSVQLHNVVAQVRRDGKTRQESYEGARLARAKGREARRRTDAADGAPGEATLRAMVDARTRRGRRIAYAAVDAGVSVNEFEQMLATDRRLNDRFQQDLMAERLRDGEDQRIAAMAMEAEGSFDREEFAQSDFEQNGGGYSVELAYEGETAGVRTDRIISEVMDGKVKYFHEPYPGADREPLALVPKAMVGRLQKDHHVLSKEQEAGLNALAAWLDK